MRVNWTPFLTLFPLRRPAKDILFGSFDFCVASLALQSKTETKGKVDLALFKLRHTRATVARATNPPHGSEHCISFSLHC